MNLTAATLYRGLLENDTRHDETDTRILDTAREVFGEHGFRKTSMEEVARKAGVSRVTLYRRFTDKDALFHAVTLREARVTLQKIVADLASLPTPEERFVKGFVSTILIARQHPLLRRLVNTETDIVLPRYYAETASQAIDLGRLYMRGIIGHLQKAGQFAGLDADYVAELLIRLWQSIVITPSSLVASDEEKSLTKLARNFLYPLLSPKR